MRLLTYAGETHSLVEWARKLGLKRQALTYRLSRGMPLEVALTPGSLVARKGEAARQRKTAEQEAWLRERESRRAEREREKTARHKAWLRELAKQKRRREAKARLKAERWAARKAQHVRWIVYEGKEWPFSELVRAKAKVSYNVVHNRLAQGWPIERALTEPVHRVTRPLAFSAEIWYNIGVIGEKKYAGSKRGY